MPWRSWAGTKLIEKRKDLNQAVFIALVVRMLISALWHTKKRRFYREEINNNGKGKINRIEWLIEGNWCAG